MTFPQAQNSPQQQQGNNRRRNRRNNHRRNRRNNVPRPFHASSSDSDSDSSTRETFASHKTIPTMMNENLFVGLDCEMVGVGPTGKKSALARVTLIDWNGNVLMDEYVQPSEQVTDYRTFVSGITPELLQERVQMDFETCRQQVLALLEGKILVGHGLKNDLRVLGIQHPWHQTRDTAKYEPFMKIRFEDGILWPRGLKDLCLEKLGRQVQTGCGPHCPYEDALAAMELYRSVQFKWEKAMEYKVNKTRAIQQQKEQQQQYFQQFPQLAARE